MRLNISRFGWLWTVLVLSGCGDSDSSPNYWGDGDADGGADSAAHDAAHDAAHNADGSGATDSDVDAGGDVDVPDVDGGVVQPLQVPGKSGTRLRRVLYEVEDVQVVKDGELYDSVLDTRCSWGVVPSGRVRCLPETQSSVIQNETQDGYFAFSDSACNHPLEEVHHVIANKWWGCGLESAPLYTKRISLFDLNNCSDMANLFNSYGTAAIHRLVGRYSATEGLYTDEPSGQCIPKQPWDLIVYYEMDEVSLGEFVEGELSPGPGGNRIETRRITSTDGLEVQAVFFDRDRDELCKVSTLDDGLPRCAPAVGTGLLTSSRFDNAQCTGEPLAQIFSQACATPTYAKEPVIETCTDVRQSLSLVTHVVATAYNKTGGDCVESTDTTYASLGVGSPVSPDVFAEAQVGPHPTPGRIQARAVSIDGLKEPVGFYDTDYGMACDPLIGADGQLRCLPAVARVQPVFLDDQCEDLVAAVYCDLDPNHDWIIVGESSDCDGTIQHVYEVGNAVTPVPTTVYKKSDGDCVQRDDWTTPLVHVGNELPASSFPLVKEIVE